MTYLDMVQLYDIKNGYDVDNISAIFEGITIDSRIDIDVMAACILDECGAMRCIYETTPTFKYFSDNFFKKYEWNITKLLNSLDFEYAPLDNYHKNWTETTDIQQNLDTEEGIEKNSVRENTGTQKNEYGEEIDNTGTQKNEYGEELDKTGTQKNEYGEELDKTGTQKNEYGEEVNKTGTQRDDYSEEVINTVSAMNSSSYEPDNRADTDGEKVRTDNLKEAKDGDNTRTDNLKEEKTGDNTRTDNLKEEKSGNNTRTDNLKEEKTGDNTRTDNLKEETDSTTSRTKGEELAWDETDTHTENGMSGSTYQDLIEKERKIAQFSVYNWISRKYASELMLLVY